jgi:hypothetical protein
MKTLKNPERTDFDPLIDGMDRDLLLGDPQSSASAHPRLQLDELLRLVEQFYSTGNRRRGNSSDDRQTRTE